MAKHNNIKNKVEVQNEEDGLPFVVYLLSSYYF